MLLVSPTHYTLQKIESRSLKHDQGWPGPNIYTVHIHRVGHNHTYVYTVCIYGIFSREMTIHAVIYGVHIRFWPTLHIQYFGQGNH